MHRQLVDMFEGFQRQPTQSALGDFGEQGVANLLEAVCGDAGHAIGYCQADGPERESRHVASRQIINGPCLKDRERIATNFVATSASNARITRARRSKLLAGQIKGEMRFTVRHAAPVSPCSDGCLGVFDTGVEPLLDNQDIFAAAWDK